MSRDKICVSVCGFVRGSPVREKRGGSPKSPPTTQCPFLVSSGFWNGLDVSLVLQVRSFRAVSKQRGYLPRRFANLCLEKRQPLFAHARDRPGDANRPHDPTIRAQDRGADASGPGLLLFVVQRITSFLRQAQLLFELCPAGDYLN